MHARILVASFLALPWIGSPATAGADQCDFIGKSPEPELALVRRHPDARIFCASCGDKVAAPFRVAKAEAAAGSAYPARIRITDRAGRSRTVDVTSVYVRLDPKAGVFTNVVNRATCRRDHQPHTIGR